MGAANVWCFIVILSTYQDFFKGYRVRVGESWTEKKRTPDVNRGFSVICETFYGKVGLKENFSCNHLWRRRCRILNRPRYGPW
jgi:hypothetical protein